MHGKCAHILRILVSMGVCLLLIPAALAQDSDNDGILDANDNCPDVANNDQADADGDGVGDLCQKDDDDDTLQIYASVGAVFNNFSASERTALSDEIDDTGHFASMEFWSQLLGKNGGHELWLYGVGTFSSRVVETDCEQNDPDCSTGVPGNPDEFFKLIEDSSTAEVEAGLQWVPFTFNDGNSAFFVKTEFGFITSVEGGDDFIDNHFLGIGVEHVKEGSAFEGSFFQAGTGRSDIFKEDSSDRLKFAAALNYYPPRRGTGERRNVGFFFETFIDTDGGDGSDDMRMYGGLTFDVGEVFKNFGK